MSSRGEEEVLVCPKCGSHFSLYYGDSGEVVSQTKCNCINKKHKRGQKPLDRALKILFGGKK